MIYHITNTQGFKSLMLTGSYKPELFSQDGFVHCSFRNQVTQTANRYFVTQDKLILFEINEISLSNYLKIENLEGGKDLFPHIYSSIPVESINQFAFLGKTKNGFELPTTWYSPFEFSNMVK